MILQLLAAIPTRVSACARSGRLYLVNYIEAIGFKLTPDSEFSMIKIPAGSGPRAEARKAEKGSESKKAQATAS